MRTELHLAMIEGRHDIPQAVDGYILSAKRMETQDVTDTKTIREAIEHRLFNLGKKHNALGKEYNTHGMNIYYGIKNKRDIYRLILQDNRLKLNVYVTGLTVVLVEIINVCLNYDIPLVLYHWNKETGEYFTQELSGCPWCK